MSDVRLRELRLTAFKSYLDASLPLTGLTVLIGRNGTGKSNALDALEILSRLSRGDDVRDAVDGGRGDAGAVRGGLQGCAPSGGDEFTLGVTVGDADEYQDAAYWATLDVTVAVRPDARIISEKLEAYLPGEGYKTLLETVHVDPERSDVFASVHNGKRGPNPQKVFRSSRLLTAQLPLRLEPQSQTDAKILQAVSVLLAALNGVFHLDPVPHLMRSYVPAQDYTLRRPADNLSAAVARLEQQDEDAFHRLEAVAQQLPEQEIQGLELGRGGFGEVMLALEEGRQDHVVVIPARQMSDGMLRILAVATALLTGEHGLALDRGLTETDVPPLCLVLEELENGLHPSQAARVLDLVKTTSTERNFQVVLTTHSPALLNALAGDDHRGVMVCERDVSTGRSTISRLTELPGYLRMMAARPLGEAVTRGDLPRARESVVRGSESVESLLGIG